MKPLTHQFTSTVQTRSAGTFVVLALLGASLAACAAESQEPTEGSAPAAAAPAAAAAPGETGAAAAPSGSTTDGDFVSPPATEAAVEEAETEVGAEPPMGDAADAPSAVAPAGTILPGTSGCSCERPVLAAGEIPTATSVGHCGPLKRSFALSVLTAGKLYINDEFIKKNGSKVVDSIQVAGSIEIQVPGVTLCNFKANSVKITKPDVRVQDGTLISNSSLFVNYAPGSSGVATRLFVQGGSADAIRVSATAAGKTQVVSQSYFTDIGKHRTPTAHCDLVQTYPVPSSGTYHSALIQQNYFSSALYAGAGSGRAVNATWMSMTDGARFEGNLVDRVFQGFWYQYDNPSITIKDNLFNRSAMDGTKYLTCTAKSNVKHSNNYWFTRNNGQIVKGDKAPTCK
jgi:hypothetical protein